MLQIQRSKHKRRNTSTFSSKNENLDGKIDIENLLTKGADINARNKWGQTPLQYAAIADCLQNIEIMTKYSGIDINSRDINGYNALQSLIAANDGESINLDDNLPVMSTSDTLSSDDADIIKMIQRLHGPKKKTFSIDLRKSLQVLVNAGIDVNHQTTFGDEYDLSSLRALLSSRDVLGRTPWNLMIGGVGYTTSAENLKTILSYGVSPEVRDTLGNTVLHTICGVSHGEAYGDVLKYLLEIGADINAQNMYGESVLSLTLSDHIFNIFCEFNADCKIYDRWGRSALVSIMKYRPCQIYS
ncbi:unnamed protein product [Mytilus edulis]|uniref:Uncharacterized protein n=1 Tax=Mytilus edulis TaxID=6550 RepID=A0A8S3SXD1_MYTED|nr:unnamed protein product [Mytilus edulis]